jgi:hypothetical protein
MFKMRLFLLFCFIAFVGSHVNVQAQDTYVVKYLYDNAGNRTDRVTEIKLASAKSAQLDSIVPLEEKMGELKVIIYPNPTKGVVRITVGGADDEQSFKMTLHNQTGSLLLNKQFVGSFECPIDLTAQPTGYYLLVLQMGSEKKTYKIIKQ